MVEETRRTMIEGGGEGGRIEGEDEEKRTKSIARHDRSSA